MRELLAWTNSFSLSDTRRVILSVQSPTLQTSSRAIALDALLLANFESGRSLEQRFHLEFPLRYCPQLENLGFSEEVYRQVIETEGRDERLIDAYTRTYLLLKENPNHRLSKTDLGRHPETRHPCEMHPLLRTLLRKQTEVYAIMRSIEREYCLSPVATRETEATAK